MASPVISVEKLSKCYVIGHRGEWNRYGGHTDLREVVRREARNTVRKAMDLFRGRQVVQGDSLEEYWALDGVSFEVHQGEVLGIIGRNGAGKSTLLKILSRLTEPTSGRVTLRGRVASLLEVGTGFHPELSGRENIFLNGAILGMTRGEIRKKFDEIVAFAEVEKFLDTPVKRYSSGMYVRLAFAVAAHLEPEILVIDEVLAVGDAEFQKKCLGKMDEVSRREGRTVLFVSHNMGVIAKLCKTAIWLEGGSIRESGPARELTVRYLSASGKNTDNKIIVGNLPRPHDGGAKKLRIEELEWVSRWPLRQGESAKAIISFSTHAPLSALAIGIAFRNFEGVQLMECNSDLLDGTRIDLPLPGKYSVVVEIAPFPLAPDTYLLDIGCRSGDVHTLDYVPGFAQMDVLPGERTLPHTIRKAAGVQLSSSWSWDVDSPRNAAQRASELRSVATSSSM